MPRSRLDRFRHHLLRRIEHYVAGLALGFVALAAWLIGNDVRALVAVPATIAGMAVVQTVIQWADRRRQQRLRAQAIAEIREMLRDQVLNQLAAMKMWVAENPDPATIEGLFAEVDGSIDEIASLIDRLTEEQLDTWKLTYANAASHWAQPDAAGEWEGERR